MKKTIFNFKKVLLFVGLMMMATTTWADVLIIRAGADTGGPTVTDYTTSENTYTFAAESPNSSDTYSVVMKYVKQQTINAYATNCFKCSDKAIIMDKSNGGYIRNTTAFGNKITKFEVYANYGASTSAVVKVCFSSTALDAYDDTNEKTVTMSTVDRVYEVTDFGTDKKYFWLKTTSAAHSQIQIKVTFETCDKEVTPAAGTKTNVSTISFDKSKVATCSSTATNRQITATITPASCYAVPSSTRLTVTGTSASYVSGPTDNGDGTYSFVYQYAQNATGTSTFAASLDTKTTYTVSYNAGSTTYTGGNAISGSHANDTKTCGTNLTLPGVTFTTTGYTQTGWTKTDGGSKTNNLSGSYTSNQAQTFYPAWTVNSYTVTWKVDGEVYTPSDSGGTDGSESVNYGSKVSTLPTPPDPNDHCGSRFMGWTTTEIYTDDDPPAVLFTTAGSAPTAEGNQTFYAVFADYAE